MKAMGGRHSPKVPQDSALGLASAGPATAAESRAVVDVAALYETHFEFVWRSLRRLGIPPSNMDDAVQDVFVVVQRRYADFEQRSTERTWLFGIALRVAAAHRRKLARRGDEIPSDEALLVGSHRDPLRAAEEAEAAGLVQRLLNELDETRRSVFVMVELEDFSVQEVSAALGVNVNTVYSRLRLARRDFDAGLKRLRARENWSER
jgi:RNA polymerase sigma-70 factor (ECF subfamily)